MSLFSPTIAGANLSAPILGRERIRPGFQGSHNEWDPLEEVIVGTAINAQIPLKDKGQLAIEFPGMKIDKIHSGSFPDQVIEETEEDIEQFMEALRKCGVKVKQPQISDHSQTFSTPDWESDGFYNYCPRDSMLVIGDTIIETPMALRCRFLEQFAYKELLLEYLKEGAKWISAPKPRLLDSIYNTVDRQALPLNNEEPVFDAANVLRAGKDIFFLISSTGNELGYEWLQTVLGKKYRVHPLRNLYDGVHLDSTMAFLQPGLVLLNPERVNDQNLPEPLRKWDKIWCPEMVDTGYVGAHPYSSVWVGMNLLMINPHLAVVDSRQIKLIKLLEQHGIDVIPLSLRHSRTLGGGFHCITLDTKRKGIFADYF